MSTAQSKLNKLHKEIRVAQKHRALARFTNLNSMFGNDWAIFFGLIGGRMTGKSYSCAEFICRQKKKYGDDVKVYWMRIADTSIKELLRNKADKMIDPDLKRKYHLNLTTKGYEVYNNNKIFISAYPLASFGKLKGVGFFDKDFKGRYIIVLDEFQLEIGEKRTSFDILYNFIGMCENLVRTTKNNIKVLLCGNTLEEASTVMKAFNFLPEKFGRFYLHSKRCVIDNIEPTEEYLKDRMGSIASLLGGDSLSNYCNELKKDTKLIDKSRRIKPTLIIQFTKDESNWYTVWDGDIIAKYKGEHLDEGCKIAMRPYLGIYFNTERRQMVFDRYDVQSWRFNNLITQAYFEGEMKLLKANR